MRVSDLVWGLWVAGFRFGVGALGCRFRIWRVLGVGVLDVLVLLGERRRNGAVLRRDARLHIPVRYLPFRVSGFEFRVS